MEQDKEGMFVDKPYGVGLTQAEIESFKKDGWELSISEPKLTFYPDIDSAGVISRYIFCRIKK